MISRVKGLRVDPECLGRERSDAMRRRISYFFGRVVDDLSQAISNDERWILFRFRMEQKYETKFKKGKTHDIHPSVLG